ncbi:MAG: hypothetical protein DRP41_05545, partial [Thermodesulfobacteriota bacterium]
MFTSIFYPSLVVSKFTLVCKKEKEDISPKVYHSQNINEFLQGQGRKLPHPFSTLLFIKQRFYQLPVKLFFKMPNFINPVLPINKMEIFLKVSTSRKITRRCYDHRC